MGKIIYAITLWFGFALMMVDGICTHIFVNRYGTKVELNPAARWVMETYGMTAFHIQKVVLSLIGLYLLWVAYKLEGLTKLLLVTVLIAVAAYAFVVIHHMSYL